MSPYEELRMLLAVVGEGEQGEKQVCPFCGGGRSGERSLSITRFEGTSGAYQCKRAQCGKEGYIGERIGTHYTPVNKPKEKEARIYDGTTEELPDDIASEYATKYGWTTEEVRSTAVGWSPEYRRTVWKIYSPTGAVRGIELRTLDPKSRAKTLHYRHSADPWVGYCGEASSPRRPNTGIEGIGCVGDGSVRTTNRPLVAVEDLISAYRVGQVFPAASIMGSHLNFDILMDLMKVSQNLILCLDRDATAKAQKFAQRYAFICPGLVHIPLQRDLKYEHSDRIKEIIQEAC